MQSYTIRCPFQLVATLKTLQNTGSAAKSYWDLENLFRTVFNERKSPISTWQDSIQEKLQSGKRGNLSEATEPASLPLTLRNLHSNPKSVQMMQKKWTHLKQLSTRALQDKCFMCRCCLFFVSHSLPLWYGYNTDQEFLTWLQVSMPA